MKFLSVCFFLDSAKTKDMFCFLCSCTLFVQVVEVRGAVIVKVADGKKIKINFKKSCQIALFSIIVFFVLIFNPEKNKVV